jgi:hypothetical protein
MSEILLKKDLRATRIELTSARRAFWTAAIVPCFTGSATSFVTGFSISVLTVSRLITGSRAVAYWAIGLLFSAFVLMFLGAHCMDRRDAAEKAERIENSRREGLNVEYYTSRWDG